MKKILLFLVLLLLLIVSVTVFVRSERNVVTNQISPIPEPTAITAGNLEIIGWFAAWDNNKASEAIPPVIDKFAVYSPMLYRVMADGSLGRHNILNWDEIVSPAREKNIPIAPVLTDEGDTDRIEKLLNDDKTQKQFIADLLTEAEEEKYSGWSIDIEKLTSKDKNAFSNFVINLSNELHKNDLKLYMIAYGRDADETYDPALAHDYKVFGEYADQVQLMIYYYSNEYTDPGGQTPLADYRSVLTYALENIPREKILIGLSTYGNDWGSNNDEVEGLTYEQVSERITQEKADISYDPNELSMVARYTKDDTDHTLMYENAKTITEKMKLARDEFGINKFAFWSLGSEDPELWEQI